MQMEYQGFVIEYQEAWEEFCVTIGETQYRNKLLSKCKEKIDSILKAKFERVNVIKANGYMYGVTTSFTSVDVTSQDGGSGKEFWVITKENKRSKEPIEKLYKNNATNNKIIESLVTMQSQIKCINKKMEEEFKKMEKWEPKAGAN